jgi:hypothetical protein
MSVDVFSPGSEVYRYIISRKSVDTVFNTRWEANRHTGDLDEYTGTFLPSCWLLIV